MISSSGSFTGLIDSIDRPTRDDRHLLDDCRSLGRSDSRNEMPVDAIGKLIID